MTEKKKLFDVKVAGGSDIRMKRAATHDTGFKHDKYDEAEEIHTVERITVKEKSPYEELGVSEARMLMFKGQKGVKITDAK